jgi:Flp pilus assembly protein TadD
LHDIEKADLFLSTNNRRVVMKLQILAMFALATTGPALAHEAPTDTAMRSFPVAYEAMAAGNTSVALEQLEATKELDRHDPSRLINMGTAYARLGKVEKARASYKAAIRSHVRYDLELANGQMMDSRDAARKALALLGDRQMASR